MRVLEKIIEVYGYDISKLVTKTGIKPLREEVLRFG